MKKSLGPKARAAIYTISGQTMLDVTLVKNPRHFDLDARRSYIAPKRPFDPAEEARQEIQEALFSREGAQLTVIARVDLKALKLRKAGGRNHDGLTVTTALFDNNGNYVAGTRRGVELRLKDETFDRWRSNGILVPCNPGAKPRNYLAAQNGSVALP
jgi:hypothetical protein